MHLFLWQASDNGVYSCRQLIIKLGEVEFLLPTMQVPVTIEVSSPDPQLTITPKNGTSFFIIHHETFFV